MESQGVESDPGEARSRLSKAIDLSRGSLSDAWRTLKSLRAESLTRLSLTCALTQYVSQLENSSSIPIDLKVSGNPRSIGGDVEHELFRIAQEALNNAVRHSSARAIQAGLSFSDRLFRLVLKDDGKGFQSGEGRLPLGFGIVVTSRTEAINEAVKRGLVRILR